jgi:hypothetical protein
MTHQPQASIAALAPPPTAIAYGARCTWWGSVAEIDSAGRCPYCHGPLGAVAASAWQQIVDVQEAMQPGYRAFVDWLRGHCCYPTLLVAEAAYWTARGAATPTITIRVDA